MTGQAGGTPSRRGLWPTLALLVVGAAVVLVAASRTWANHLCTFSSACGRPSNPVRGPHVVTALALLALAAVVAMFAVRGALRSAVGVVVGLAGVFIVIASVTAGGGAWRWIAAAGGAVILAAGVLIVTRGGPWPSMSTRYEREERAATKPLSAWDAIDRGEDPTE
jgi:hypothetical protein